jgi:hypothetical protein
MNTRLKHFRDLCRELHLMADDLLWSDALSDLGPTERAALERRIDAKLRLIASHRSVDLMRDNTKVIPLKVFLHQSADEARP